MKNNFMGAMLLVVIIFSIGSASCQKGAILDTGLVPQNLDTRFMFPGQTGNINVVLLSHPLIWVGGTHTINAQLLDYYRLQNVRIRTSVNGVMSDRFIPVSMSKEQALAFFGRPEGFRPFITTVRFEILPDGRLVFML